MSNLYMITPTNNDIEHHGILGQKWGRRNGPPYPLEVGAHSASEKKAGYQKSISGSSSSTSRSSTGSSSTDSGIKSKEPSRFGATVKNAGKAVGSASLKGGKAVGGAAGRLAKAGINKAYSSAKNKYDRRKAIREDVKEQERKIQDEIYRNKLETKLKAKYKIKEEYGEMTVGRGAKEVAKYGVESVFFGPILPLGRRAVVAHLKQKKAEKEILKRPTDEEISRMSDKELRYRVNSNISGKSTAKQRHSMSDEELSYRVGRVRQEDTLRELEASNVDAGEKWIKSTGSDITKRIITTAAVGGGLYLLSSAAAGKGYFNRMDLGKAVFKGGAGKKG